MFGRSKPTPPKREKKQDLSKLGIFGISDDVELIKDDSDDAGDSDLEAELAAITGGSRAIAKAKTKNKDLVSPAQLDAMVASSLRDIGSDEEVSGDDDDPDLLNELAGITGEEIDNEAEEEAPKKPSNSSENVQQILRARLEMYVIAEQNAIKANESSKARRYNRGLKTLKDLIKQTESGKSVNMDDIPPEVSVKGANPKPENETDNATAPPVPSRKAPSPPSPATPAPIAESPVATEEVKEDSLDEITRKKIDFLNNRKNEYKIAALECKNKGDKNTAIKYIKICKQFETVIAALTEGKEVDLSNMPPSPSSLPENSAANTSSSGPSKEEAETQRSGSAEVKEEAVDDEPTLKVATTVAEALEQRLEVYRSMVKKSEEENNSSKARRYGRIVKQYEDSMKLHKAGKNASLDELPVPPGYGPFPNENASSAAAAAPTPKAPAPVPPKPKPVPNTPAANVVQQSGSQTRLDKQMDLLLNRQKEFRTAAIEAKKAGDLEGAKEHLRTFKQFESLIEKASGGLTIDMSTLPIPPGKRDALEETFTIVDKEDIPEASEGGAADRAAGGEENEISIRLQEQLAKQLMMCKNTRDHFRAMGEVSSMNRFENLALGVQKDLDFVRLAHKEKLRTPKFHYEQKNFTIIKCNTDLNDNEVEINVMRGINYTVPNPRDVDTYVKIEFPYPQEDPFKIKTALVKDTDNPEYNHKCNVEIQRNVRACQRLFKRQTLKCEVYSKGGFLRSDTLIGTANIKLQPLETVCDIHDSFPLVSGRKTVGTLEVKVRVRNPILTKEMEHLNEKWLIIDS